MSHIVSAIKAFNYHGVISHGYLTNSSDFQTLSQLRTEARGMMIKLLLLFLVCWSALPLEASPLGKRYNLEIDGKKYYISLAKTNWFEASNHCRQNGGFLLNLESREELELLSPHLHPAYSYWLSINDLGERGAYVSEATGLEAPFLNWSAGEPDNSTGHDRCVELWLSTSSFQMNDLACYSPVAFICQLN
ncbi:C-type lectin 37Db [Drosophila simulans]|nr:C-type lectin 37Db [Drosophila simulans]